MKSKLLIGIMITGMIVVTGCSNDSNVAREKDISNSNSIEKNYSSENNEEVIKTDVKIESIPVGAYIKYQPSSTSCIVLSEDSGHKNQTYNPSTITSWKVFKNNNGQLDIISSESVGSLCLVGKTGYAKAVYTLNKMCSEYVNPTYAISGRSLGYVEGSSMETIDIEEYPMTWENTYKNGNCEFPYTDTYYINDKEIIKTVIYTDQSLLLQHDVWLASRWSEAYSGISMFGVCHLNSSGLSGSSQLYNSHSDGRISTYFAAHGVHPVISLKDNIKITAGNGTKESPYIISI